MKVIKSLFWDIPIWAVRAILFCIMACCFWVFRLLEWAIKRILGVLGGLLLKNQMERNMLPWYIKALVNFAAFLLVPIKILKNAFLYATVWIVPLKDEVKR